MKKKIQRERERESQSVPKCRGRIMMKGRRGKSADKKEGECVFG